MKLSQGQRQQAIEYLIANCDGWKHPGDREVLNGLSDDKIVHLKTSAEREQAAIAVANAAVNGFTVGNRAFRVNPEKGQWESRVVKNAATDRAQGEMTGSTCTDNEEDEESALPARKVAPERRPMPPAPSGEVAETDVPPPEEEEYVGNRRRRSKSLDDWMRTAPVEVQNMVRTAREVEIREKDAVIAQLLVNVDERDRQAHRDRLIQRTLADLKNDLALVPRSQSRDDDGEERQVNNRSRPARKGAFDPDVLLPQTIDWKAVKPGDDLLSVQQPAVVGNAADDRDDDDEEYQEYLRRAPEKVRQQLQNAAQVEAKEKRRIIEQLVANVDEASEQKLRASLQRKSLADLKDLLLLSPPKPRQPSNWFGASGASPSLPIGNRSSAADPSEDVLIPQVIDFRENSKLVS